DHAENILAVLADAHVPGADPRTWNGIAELSTRKALREPEENVHVSPSQVDSFITCPQRWALEQAGGRGADSMQQHFATLIHEVAAGVAEGTQEQMKEILDELLPSLQLPHGWIEITKRAEAEESVRRLAQYRFFCFSAFGDFDPTVGQLQRRPQLIKDLVHLLLRPFGNSGSHFVDECRQVLLRGISAAATCLLWRAWQRACDESIDLR